jgi:hypothetical protein
MEIIVALIEMKNWAAAGRNGIAWNDRTAQIAYQNPI